MRTTAQCSKIFPVFLLTLACLLPGPTARAANMGFGLSFVSAKYSVDTGFLGTGLTNETNETGFALDFQIPVSENITINPFFLSTSGDTDVFDAPFFLAKADVTTDIFGIQLRIWPTENFYLTAMLESLNQKVEPQGFIDEEGSGTGFGFGFGAEMEIASGFHFTIGYQIDQVDGVDLYQGFSPSDLNGARLLLGVRFATGE